jgi:hypothetical protein
LVQKLYDGIEAADDYHSLRRRMEEASWTDGRMVFPNQTATLKHVDFEPNGELDATQAPGKIQLYDEPTSQAATGLMSGVHFLRSMNPYYVEESERPIFSLKQAKLPVLAKGLYRGNGAAVVRVKPVTKDGKQRFEITLDSRFKNESRTFIGAATVFELQLALQQSFINAAGRREKIRALAFAADYLDLIPRDRAAAQTALDRVATMNGLPKLSIWSIQGALNGHVVSEAGVDRLERLVADAEQPAAPR